MKKFSIFVLLLTTVLFLYELSVVLQEKGTWFFVFINVFLFFTALLTLGSAYYEEKQLIIKKRKEKYKALSPRWVKSASKAKKHVWGDTRKFRGLNGSKKEKN